jgi:hypothetical protein
MMNVPSRVVKLETMLKTSSSIILQWEVLPKESDAIQQFYIFAYERSNDELDKRNYCNEPIVKEEETTTVMNIKIDVEKSLMPTDKNRCCQKCCEQENAQKQQREKEDDSFRESMIENAQENMRQKRRTHRDQMGILPGFLKKMRVDGVQRTAEVNELDTFAYYSFHVYACTEDQKCSDYEMHCDKTAINDKFDQIKLHLETSEFLIGTFRVFFEEPKERNGAIINYLIELREKIDDQAVLIKQDCVTRKVHEDNKYL